MASIIPLTDLSMLATGSADGIEPDDAYALWCLEQASALVRDHARHPEWTETGIDAAPLTAKRIVLAVARRVYVNAGQEVATGVGPISSRVLDEAAAGLRLTEAEAAEIAALRGVDGAGNPNGLWVMTNTEGTPEVTTGYVFDDSGSDWAIPYIHFPSTDAMTDPSDTVLP